MTDNEPRMLKWDSNNGLRAVAAQLKSGREPIFVFRNCEQLEDDDLAFGTEQHLGVLLANSNVVLKETDSTIGVPFSIGWQSYPNMAAVAEGFIELATWRDGVEVFGPEAMRALTEFYDSERRHRFVEVNSPAIP